MGTITRLNGMFNAIIKAMQDTIPALLYSGTTNKFKGDAILSQATPVQNQWYTVLDTTVNARIIGMTGLIVTTGETLEMKITIDGVVVSGSQAATADTWYQFYPHLATANGLFATTSYTGQVAFLFEGRSIKIEIRKTTANGTGNLKSVVTYAKR